MRRWHGCCAGPELWAPAHARLPALTPPALTLCPRCVSSQGIFQHDNVNRGDVEKLVDAFPGQSIDFFGALRARVYDDKVGACIRVDTRISVSSTSIFRCSVFLGVLAVGSSNVRAAGMARRAAGEAAVKRHSLLSAGRCTGARTCMPWRRDSAAGLRVAMRVLSTRCRPQVREWISGVGVENIGKRLVNSREGKVEFEKPSVSVCI